MDKDKCIHCNEDLMWSEALQKWLALKAFVVERVYSCAVNPGMDHEAEADQ